MRNLIRTRNLVRYVFLKAVEKNLSKGKKIKKQFESPSISPLWATLFLFGFFLFVNQAWSFGSEESSYLQKDSIPEAKEEIGNTKEKPPKHLILSFGIIYNSISSSYFDGAHLIQNKGTGQVVLVPHLESGQGYSFFTGLCLGGADKFQNWMGINFNWGDLASSSNFLPTHDFPMATLLNIDAQSRLSYRVSRYFDPYLQFSYGYFFLTANDIAVSGGTATNITVYDSEMSFSGKSFSIGLGSCSPLSEWFAIDVSLAFQSNSVDSFAEGNLNEGSIQNWVFRLAPTLTF